MSSTLHPTMTTEPDSPEPIKKIRGLNSKSRARKRKAILERDGPYCWWCEFPFTKDDPSTIEHIVPRSKGGTHDLENLANVHRRCNR